MFAEAALHSQAAGLSLHRPALGVTASGNAACAAPEEPPPALSTPAPGTGLQPHQREDWAPCRTSAYQLVTLTDCICRE